MAPIDTSTEVSDLSVDARDISVDEMKERFVARFDELEFIWNQYLDTKLPGYSRSQAHVIGGFNELAEFKARIEHVDGFMTALMRIPAGGRVAQHNHRTVEVLFPLEGAVTVMWGLKNDSADGLHEIDIGRFDTIAIPAGIFRTFHNRTEEDALVLFTIGACREPGPVHWPEWLRETAQQAGWEFDAGGVLREVSPTD